MIRLKYLHHAFFAKSWEASAEAAATLRSVRKLSLQIGWKLKRDDISGHTEAHLHLQPVQSHRRPALIESKLTVITVL